MDGNIIIFDTSIFIDHLRTNCHKERIEAASGLIRNSSVVLAELWRGATKASEKGFLKALARNHPILHTYSEELAGIWPTLVADIR